MEGESGREGRQKASQEAPQKQETRTTDCRYGAVDKPSRSTGGHKGSQAGRNAHKRHVDGEDNHPGPPWRRSKDEAQGMSGVSAGGSPRGTTALPARTHHRHEAAVPSSS